MARYLIGLYKENTFYEQWHQIPQHKIKNMMFPHKFEDHFGLHASVIFFRPQYVWFPSHFYIGVIPNSSGQLVELFVYIIPRE